MKGLELAEKYYESYGDAMLREKFPELSARIAVGLVGSGSEMLGFDDEVSQDHDFEPGFCIFLPGEETVSRREAFLLERAYAALPKEFMGFRRGYLSPVGGNRRGVIRLSDFLTDRLGNPDGRFDIHEWLTIPEQYLLEVTGGRLFRDDSGFFTEIRERLYFLPPSIVLKKLAGNLLFAAQSGQYNYGRCLDHGENAAAQTALFYFTEAAMHCMFLLSARYMPYYKWRFRAFAALKNYSHFLPSFEFLLTGQNTEAEVKKKQRIIRDILQTIMKDCGCPEETDPGKCAYELNDRITNERLRNLHILSAVHEG